MTCLGHCETLRSGGRAGVLWGQSGGTSMSHWLLMTVGVGVVLVLLDRLLLWLEGRGWIYYRKKKASPGSLGSAMLEIQALLRPSGEHVVEERRAVKSEEDEAGEPPEPPDLTRP